MEQFHNFDWLGLHLSVYKDDDDEFCCTVLNNIVNWCQGTLCKQSLEPFRHTGHYAFRALGIPGRSQLNTYKLNSHTAKHLVTLCLRCAIQMFLLTYLLTTVVQEVQGHIQDTRSCSLAWRTGTERCVLRQRRTEADFRRTNASCGWQTCCHCYRSVDTCSSQTASPSSTCTELAMSLRATHTQHS